MTTQSSASVSDRYTEEEVSGYYDAGYWRHESLYEDVVAQAEARPDKVFVFDSTTSYTYARLRDDALRLAAGLRRLGLERGDRVVVQLPNWAEFALVAVALSRLGVVVVPVMPIYREAEVSYVVEHSGAVAAVTCDSMRGFSYLEMYAAVQGGHPELRHLILARAEASSPGTSRHGARELASLMVPGDLAELAAEVGPDSSPDDPFLIVYTSGTTARPKGCCHTYNTIRASSAAIATSIEYTADDVQFGPSPITHGTGLVTSLVLPLIAGASSHLMEAWEPTEGIERIQRHGCTVTVTATAFLQMMMGVHDPSAHDLSSMRYWVCAGAPIPGSVVQRAGQMLGGGRVLSLYGRSENFLTTMCTATDPPERSATSDGRALAGASVKVVDVLGDEVQRGAEGDIAYKGPSHMLGYYRNPAETDALFTPDGYSTSGDLGSMDRDGFVRVTGRTKDIIIRGGLNISAREIEDLLLDHVAIGSVVAVGMPDERLGEKVCVYVVPAPGHEAPTLDEITDFLRQRHVATPKLPERLEVVGSLPMTATGKIQKHLLREEIAAKLRA
ncbi:MAG TPA: AMP-binding protein [Intrasporangium sp.]|uniref:AMP-binding protein n=1 Tax=Intrasporangium sp. TaxID=1925024 RepID=UPI002D7A26DC|nr:AMP-binding protein [Intrasporangium sp.]HET7399119.1 AMP-binding protein [Intrasporangium sp.]